MSCVYICIKDLNDRCVQVKVIATLPYYFYKLWRFISKVYEINRKQLLKSINKLIKSKFSSFA